MEVALNSSIVVLDSLNFHPNNYYIKPNLNPASYVVESKILLSIISFFHFLPGYFHINIIPKILNWVNVQKYL